MSPDEDIQNGRDRTAELLSQALHEEAAMVHTDPSALHEIQQRTRTSGSPRRSWLYAGLGAAAATAAVITGVTVLGSGGDPDGAGPAVNGPTKSVSTEDTAAPPPGGKLEPGVLLYVGATTHRIFAERHPVPVDDNIAVMNLMLSSPPADPDYTTGWPEGVRVGGFAETNNGARLDLTGPAGAATQLAADPGLGNGGGKLAITALLFTGNFQAGEGFNEVTYNGEPISTLLGVPLPFTLPEDSDVQAFIQVLLAEGQTLNNPVSVKVVGNTFEGTVNWQLLDGSGAKLDEGFVTTSRVSGRRRPSNSANSSRGPTPSVASSTALRTASPATSTTRRSPSPDRLVGAYRADLRREAP